MTTMRVQPTDDDVIAIPRRVMQRYGLKPDDVITVDEQPKRIVLMTECDPLDRLFEAIKKLNFHEEDWEEIHKERHRDDPYRV